MQPSLRDDQKLQGLVQQCVYKTVELVLRARIPNLHDGGDGMLPPSNLWVRRAPHSPTSHAYSAHLNPPQKCVPRV